MSGLALFVETPRAGELGHRFLVAGNDQARERQIAEYVKSVDKDVSVGANFIGVARSVRQHSGTAIRTGREIIVLAGVDVSRITGPSRDQLLTTLQKHLDRLEHLVLRGIDWSRLPNAELVVRSAELSQWLDEIRAFQFPETEWLGGPRPLAPADVGLTSTRRPRISRPVVGFVLLVSLLATLFVVGTWFFGTPQNGADRSAAHQELENRGQGSKASDSEYAIRELADEWACSPDDVSRSLLRAANWDRRREADTLSFDIGLNDGEVRPLVDKVTSKAGVERMLVSPAVDSEPHFRNFAIRHRSSPVTASHDVRRWLYGVWGKWGRLRESVANANKALPAMEKADDLTRMMVVVAQLEPDVGLGDGFREPITPLFDRQDVMIWRFLNQCRVTMKSCGINEFLREPVASPPISELASFLAAVRMNRTEIVATIAGSRSQAAETVGNSQGQEAEKSVRDAYRAFEDFVEYLARFDDR